ncbi:MAG: apolipoprotein N-acyltransferase [Clostridia bacterium]|nr:apolipoprotein N-acyltransferase [Clostridia bacterium]
MKDNVSSLTKKELRIIKLTAAAGGILCGLPFVLKELWFLGWIAPALLVFALARADADGRCSMRRAYAVTYCFFYPFYLSGYYWILYMYPMEYAEVTPLFSACVLTFGLLAMAFLFTVPFAFIGPLFVYISRKLRGRGSPRLLSLLSFPFLWIIFEWIQTLTWAGVPFVWLAVGQQYMLPAIQSASLLGVLFVDFLMVLVGALLAFALLIKEKRRILAAAAVAVFLVNIGFGTVRLLVPLSDADNMVTAAAVQGNISSIDEKWNMEYAEIREVYIDLINSAADDGAELIVLSESALPAYFNVKSSRFLPFAEIAKNRGVTILLGGYYRVDNGNDVYASGNAIYTVNPDGTIGQEQYIKRKLVPFGEYVPMRPFIETVFPALTEISMLSVDGGRGEDSALHDTVYGKRGSLVCYDSVYNTLALESVRDGAELLAVSTDDSWFERSPELYLHLGHSVLRSIENGRYLVRAANTGISAIIDPKGRVIDPLPADAVGYSVGEIGFRSESTLFTLVGNAIVSVAFLYLAAVGIYSFIPIAKSKNKI